MTCRRFATGDGFGDRQQVDDEESSYPMETFERLGLAILDHVEGATLDVVWL